MIAEQCISFTAGPRNKSGDQVSSAHASHAAAQPAYPIPVCTAAQSTRHNSPDATLYTPPLAGSAHHTQRRTGGPSRACNAAPRPELETHSFCKPCQEVVSMRSCASVRCHQSPAHSCPNVSAHTYVCSAQQHGTALRNLCSTALKSRVRTGTDPFQALCTSTTDAPATPAMPRRRLSRTAAQSVSCA